MARNLFKRILSGIVVFDKTTNKISIRSRKKKRKNRKIDRSKLVTVTPSTPGSITAISASVENHRSKYCAACSNVNNVITNRGYDVPIKNTTAATADYTVAATTTTIAVAADTDTTTTTTATTAIATNIVRTPTGILKSSLSRVPPQQSPSSSSASAPQKRVHFRI